MAAHRHLEAETATLRQFLEENNAQIRAALLRLDQFGHDFATNETYEFQSAYPADTATLKLRGTKELKEGRKPTPDVLAAHLYDVGRTANLLHAFRWTRRKAIAECLETLKFSLAQGSLLPALVLTRTILEHVGIFELFDRDLLRIKREGGSSQADDGWVLEVYNALGLRMMGTKIDWADYLGSGLKGKRRKGYKVEEGHLDTEARDLLNGIDLLDKVVTGTRNAYEFLSEFGHPNYPSFQLGVASAEITKHRHGFRMLKKVYAGDRVPRVGVGELRPLLRDVWEILVAALERFQELDTRLAQVENEVGMATRLWVRKFLRRRQAVLRAADPCPCFSGRLIAGCCGK